MATTTVSFGGTEIDIDAIVVWRIVDGRVSEAWDIPAINTVRPHPSLERRRPIRTPNEDVG